MKKSLLIFQLFGFFSQITVSQTIGVKGPPHAKETEIKQVEYIGTNVRIVCPVQGFPAPMVEWSKDGENIDYTWDRYKTTKKALKIRKATQDDTGVFICKGINGFGSEQVRIELIVVDPRTLPDSYQNSKVAPPVFTHETRFAKKKHKKSLGDTFKVSCEALGSPNPEIFWFKDGQHIDEWVHYRKGRSSVEFTVRGSADSGVYTCRARNLVGEKTTNFTLDVKGAQGSAAHAIVTESGPANTTVVEGESAMLRCRVKAVNSPRIKWLKQLDDDDVSEDNTLLVGQERYRILNSSVEQKVGEEDYLSQLILPGVTVAASGMYICFVTNSGFGALTYNSMNLRVVERPTDFVDNVNRAPPNQQDPEPFSMLIMVICLSILVFAVLMAIIICVIRKKAKASRPLSPESPELHRPFMQKNNNNKMFTQPLPLHNNVNPVTNFWRGPVNSKVQQVYPTNEYQQKLGTDSGFDASLCLDRHSPHNEPSLNQYEIPYSHLLQKPGHPHQLPSHFNHFQQPSVYSSSYTRDQLVANRPLRSVISGASGDNHYYPSNSHHRNLMNYNQPNGKLYLSDYESQ